jgi:hypothetical protein
MLLGVVVLAVTTMAACGPNGPGPAGFVLGVTISVCLGWLGYRVQRNMPREPSADLLLATLAAPVPSERAIGPEDVLGPWQFYVDAATSTVTIDLQADGHYRQVIVGNGGRRIDCPGGTWTLDGSYLELDSYRSAVRATTERVRWFFGDWEQDFVLFAKDDPQSETMLLGLRGTGAAVQLPPRL